MNDVSLLRNITIGTAAWIDAGHGVVESKAGRYRHSFVSLVLLESAIKSHPTRTGIVRAIIAVQRVERACRRQMDTS